MIIGHARFKCMYRGLKIIQGMSLQITTKVNSGIVSRENMNNYNAEVFGQNFTLRGQIRRNYINFHLLMLTVCIRIVADCVALPCQDTRKLKRATTLEHTTVTAIIFIHCQGLGFILLFFSQTKYLIYIYMSYCLFSKRNPALNQPNYLKFRLNAC